MSTDVIILNHFEAYGFIGGLPVFVNYRKCKNFWVQTSGKTFLVREPIKVSHSIYFYFENQLYCLGRPSLEYWMFLHQSYNGPIDIEFPVIYDPIIFDITEMVSKKFDEESILECDTKNLIIIGKSFYHNIVADGEIISTSPILDAYRDDDITKDIDTKSESNSILIVETVDEMQYYICSSSNKDVKLINW